MDRRKKQQGAVSIFAVIFSALFMAVLTVGFIKLMIQDQQQATNNDLSQSAYDAALAGVEDAKRVIRASQSGNTAATAALSDKPKSEDCRVITRSGILGGASSDRETQIRTSSDRGREFNQAYTCVNIHMQSPDFIYKAPEDSSELVPLRAAEDFHRVVIEWYRRDDERNQGRADAANLHRGIALGALPKAEDWRADKGKDNVPPLMRAQIIHPNATGVTGDIFTRFDNTGGTLFLWPRVFTHASEPSSVGLPARATNGNSHFKNEPVIATCSKDFGFSGEYSCKAIIDVGHVVRASSEYAFLRLNSLYKGASIKVSLYNKANRMVAFDGVQPVVDATGRAANMFRRVEARLRIGEDFKYPDSAVEVINSLCKDFSVHDTGAVNGVCRP